MTRHRTLAIALAIAAFFAQPNPAAAKAYYAFSGVIDSSHTEYAGLAGFFGLFSFDPTRPDAAPADPHDGYYPMDGGIYGMSVQFAGGPLFTTDPAASFSFRVHVAFATVVGQPPDVGHFDIKGTVADQVDRFVGLSFRKDFATDALPGASGTFDLADFDQVLFFYEGLAELAPGPGETPLPPYGAYGHLTSLTCVDGCIPVVDDPVPASVPEPSTMALLFAGLAVPGLIAGRRRSQDPAPA